MRKILLAGCVLALTSASYAATFAGISNGVWSTGAQTTTVILGSGSVSKDSNYTLIRLPANCAAAGIQCDKDLGTAGVQVFGPESFVIINPHVNWTPNDSSSTWIGPRADQSTVNIFPNDSDFYVYRMVFNLTALGLDPATAAISLNWWSDNAGAPASGQNVDSHIRLCSITTANDPICGSGSTVANSQHAVGSFGYSGSGTTVNINSGFSSGLMAMDFVVYNAVFATGLNPSGLRVQILSANALSTDTNVAGAPEPATFALLGSALAGLALLRRRS